MIIPRPLLDSSAFIANWATPSLAERSNIALISKQNACVSDDQSFYCSYAMSKTVFVDLATVQS